MERVSTATQPAVWLLSECLPAEAAPRTIALREFPFMVGRLPECSLCIPAAKVSKQHAQICSEAGRLYVNDLGSTNGTFVNRRRVSGREPLHDGDMLYFASEAFRVQRKAADAHMRTVAEGSFVIVESLCQFDRLMSERAIIPHFQPVVSLHGGEIVGYEMLARGSLSGLEGPGAMFGAAQRLGQEIELSMLLRSEGVRVGQRLPGQPRLYLNTHPAEVAAPKLVPSLKDIRCLAPRLPITIEVHEAAVARVEDLLELRAACRELNMQLAYDDFGAGQARLDELARVAPDCVKFDMRLVRDLHHAPAERLLVTERLVALVRELGIVPLAEGVENQEEADACRNVGFTLAQGYFFGRPAPLGQRGLIEPHC
jgi:EAL domain-containing protein (putative c-di-GMP-specific phosphodiesterase class I)